MEKMARLDPLRRAIARSPTKNQMARPETYSTNYSLVQSLKYINSHHKVKLFRTSLPKTTNKSDNLLHVYNYQSYIFNEIKNMVCTLNTCSVYIYIYTKDK